jgi:integrase
LVESLTEDHFVAYRTMRREGLDWKTKARVKPLKPSTINAHLDRANDVFEWALTSTPPRAVLNPVARLVARGHKLRVERFEPVVIDGETIEQLIDAADPLYRLELALMGHLALRWGEALGVGVGHIKDGQVLIRQQVIENREVKPARMEISTYGGKSEYAKRDLYASERILDAAGDAYERLSGSNSHRLLRPTGTGAPYRENNWLRDAWRPAVKRAGLEGSGITPHSLRHSRLSLMAKSGKVTPGDLKRFAGHRDVAFTLSRYGDHFSSEGILPEVYLSR